MYTIAGCEEYNLTGITCVGVDMDKDGNITANRCECVSDASMIAKNGTYPVDNVFWMLVSLNLRSHIHYPSHILMSPLYIVCPAL